ncbi:hypothetical protein BGW80DRAFT_1300072, partial [Lactifluus volemus]
MKHGLISQTSRTDRIGLQYVLIIYLNSCLFLFFPQSLRLYLHLAIAVFLLLGLNWTRQGT